MGVRSGLGGHAGTRGEHVRAEAGPPRVSRHPAWLPAPHSGFRPHSAQSAQQPALSAPVSPYPRSAWACSLLPPRGLPPLCCGFGAGAMAGPPTAPHGTVWSLRGACAEVPRQAPRSEAPLPHCAPGRLPPGSEPWFRGPLVRPHPWASSAPPPSVQGAQHLCGGVWFLLVSCAIRESGLPARSAGSCAPVANYTVPRARATISITAVSLLLLTNAGVCSGVMPEPQAGVGAPTRRPGSLGHLGRVI